VGEILKRHVLDGFMQAGKASFLIGGQWGSEAKGAAAAWLADELATKGNRFDIYTTNAGAQAGHTSIYNGKKRVVFHLPTAPLIVGDVTGCYAARGLIYLNAGSIIDPVVLMQELHENNIDPENFEIHPMAAVIAPEDTAAEQDNKSAQTKIASTRKGVGQALARKVLRSGVVARDHPMLKKFVRRRNLNSWLQAGKSVLVEVPQGVSLSLNHSKFYPYTTSRDCTVMSAMSDAGIHPHFYGKTMMVLRTFPIRVGNIPDLDGKVLGTSGDCYPDQKETDWGTLGVEAEITTVTKRVRRVFTYSAQQVVDSVLLTRPDIIFLSFCNYVREGHGQTAMEQLRRIKQSIRDAASAAGIPVPFIIEQYGPTNEDVQIEGIATIKPME
jgi:adenylosuccinate synthase